MGCAASRAPGELQPPAAFKQLYFMGPPIARGGFGLVYRGENIAAADGPPASGQKPSSAATARSTARIASSTAVSDVRRMRHRHVTIKVIRLRQQDKKGNDLKSSYSRLHQRHAEMDDALKQPIRNDEDRAARDAARRGLAHIRQQMATATKRTDPAVMQDEVQILEQCSSSFCCQLIDVFKVPQGAFIVFERYVGDLGQCLQAVTRRNARGVGIAEEHASQFAAHLAAGLTFLHAKRIVHRDLKPANVFMRHRRPLEYFESIAKKELRAQRAQEARGGKAVMERTQWPEEDPLPRFVAVIGDFGLANQLPAGKHHVRGFAGSMSWLSYEHFVKPMNEKNFRRRARRAADEPGSPLPSGHLTALGADGGAGGGGPMSHVSGLDSVCSERVEKLVAPCGLVVKNRRLKDMAEMKLLALPLDIFALGAVSFFMLTGFHMYDIKDIDSQGGGDSQGRNGAVAKVVQDLVQALPTVGGGADEHALEFYEHFLQHREKPCEPRALGGAALDFLADTLAVIPTHRGTAREALHHPFLVVHQADVDRLDPGQDYYAADADSRGASAASRDRGGALQRIALQGEEHATHAPGAETNDAPTGEPATPGDARAPQRAPAQPASDSDGSVLFA